MKSGSARLTSSARVQMRSDIVPGGSFPDYELRDHGGAKRKLSALQGADPMILVLSRGSFCPKDPNGPFSATSASSSTPIRTTIR